MKVACRLSVLVVALAAFVPSPAFAAPSLQPERTTIPAEVKARGDKLWAASSPAVRSWVAEQTPLFEKGTSDPEPAAFQAVHLRWPKLRVDGQNDVAFVLLYRAAVELDAEISRLELLANQGSLMAQQLHMSGDAFNRFLTSLANILKKRRETTGDIVSKLK